MSKLIARLRQDYPKHEYISTFEAAIPAYSVQMIFEVLQKQELTTFQRYILELLSLGINSPDTMGHYLGVDQEVLTSSIAGLLKLQFVEQGNPQPGREDRLFFLTGSGKEAVIKQGPPPVPARTTGRFFFNALTESIVSPSEELKYPDQVNKQGLFVLPPKEEGKPALSKFLENEKDVKSVLKDEPAFKDATIVGFLKLKETSARYFAPVTVVVLQDRETRERTVAVYRNSIQQRPETVNLQFLLDSKKFHIPSNSTPLSMQEQEISIPTRTLPADTVQEIRKVVENEQQREEYITQVEEQKILKTATQDARERQALEERLRELQREVQVKDQDIQLLRQQLQQKSVEFLRTAQHRAKLLQAVREAKEQLIIISPWMTPEACNEELCVLFAKALLRGVHLHIGYYMGIDRNLRNAAYNQRNVEEVIKAIKKHLQKLNPSHSIDLEKVIVKTTGTHQKILVCDKQFAITGSFNWLSFTGEGNRHELSVLFRHLDQINELTDIALETWNSPK